VADDGTETTAETGPTTAELDSKVNALDSKVDMILDKLSGSRDQAHTAAQQHTEDRLDRPSTVAEEIRQQLAAQRAADERAAAEKGAADRLAAVEAKVTGMAEQAPEPITRRVEKLMGWR
jgi:hypothetical protein